jgi:hypothetical protein
MRRLNAERRIVIIPIVGRLRAIRPCDANNKTQDSSANYGQRKAKNFQHQ